jgi:hypothetical protein
MDVSHSRSLASVSLSVCSCGARRTRVRPCPGASQLRQQLMLVLLLPAYPLLAEEHTAADRVYALCLVRLSRRVHVAQSLEVYNTLRSVTCLCLLIQDSRRSPRPAMITPPPTRTASTLCVAGSASTPMWSLLGRFISNPCSLMILMIALASTRPCLTR